LSARIDNADDLTPWSTLRGVGSVRIYPPEKPVCAEIAIPGSKSISNRALILAAMSDGITRLSGLLHSNDTYWCADALQRLGSVIDFDGSNATVRGIGRSRPKQGTIHVGSAGTAARFLPPLLAAGDAGQWLLTASKQMMARPMRPLFQALSEGGAVVSFTGREGCLPVTVTGATFEGGSIRMSGAVSSQFISGILMAAAQSRHGVELDIDDSIVQSDYVRMTLDAMRHFGASVTASDGLDHFSVPPAGYRSRDLDIEADASTATYFGALAAVTGGQITLSNLTAATRQPDYGFLGVLEKLGCRVERTERGTTVCRTQPLRGGFSIDMRPLSDSALTLAAIAPFADAPITITGVEHIRHHECDRVDAICRSLAAVAVPVQEHQDGLTISPAPPRFAVLDTFEDHRVAMALAVLGAGGQGLELLNPSSVSKTCPSFFEMIASVGVKTELVPASA
jgi:3-phosphoshikimate 1-carboxyvinyltransferase